MKKFWSSSFLVIVFIPLSVLACIDLYCKEWETAIYHLIMLAALCWNNYLLCENYQLKEELFDELQTNLLLVEYIRKKLKKEKNKNDTILSREP